FTFVCALNACSHCGLVSEARRLLSLMPQFNVKETEMHRTCLVDAHARAGDLDGAVLVAQAQQKPYVHMWMTILSQCRDKKTRDDIAEQCFEEIKKIATTNNDVGSLAAAYVLYNQILTRAGRLDEAKRVESERLEKRIFKIKATTTFSLNGIPCAYEVDALKFDSWAKAAFDQFSLNLEKEGYLKKGEKPCV